MRYTDTSNFNMKISFEIILTVCYHQLINDFILVLNYSTTTVILLRSCKLNQVDLYVFDHVYPLEKELVLKRSININNVSIQLQSFPKNLAQTGPVYFGNHQQVESWRLSTVRANEKRDVMAEPLRLNWVDLNFRRTKVGYCQSAVWRPTVSLYICADSMY